MAETRRRISFHEFSDNLADVLERVVSLGEEVVVETEAGELLTLKPLRRAKRRRRVKTKADHEAFLASLGGWKDVDTFLKDNEESRRISMAGHDHRRRIKV